MIAYVLVTNWDIFFCKKLHLLHPYIYREANFQNLQYYDFLIKNSRVA